MTDREPWLQSIRSNPSDWQAMLVFADWLEESGDLLAAEQWRWIAVVCGDNGQEYLDNSERLVRHKPNYGDDLMAREKRFAAENNIRCMPHYPLTIEDVHAYLDQNC